MSPSSYSLRLPIFEAKIETITAQGSLLKACIQRDLEALKRVLKEEPHLNINFYMDPMERPNNPIHQALGLRNDSPIYGEEWPTHFYTLRAHGTPLRLCVERGFWEGAELLLSLGAHDHLLSAEKEVSMGSVAALGLFMSLSGKTKIQGCLLAQMAFRQLLRLMAKNEQKVGSSHAFDLIRSEAFEPGLEILKKLCQLQEGPSKETVDWASSAESLMELGSIKPQNAKDTPITQETTDPSLHHDDHDLTDYGISLEHWQAWPHEDKNQWLVHQSVLKGGLEQVRREGLAFKSMMKTWRGCRSQAAEQKSSQCKDAIDASKVSERQDQDRGDPAMNELNAAGLTPILAYLEAAVSLKRQQFVNADTPTLLQWGLTLLSEEGADLSLQMPKGEHVLSLPSGLAELQVSWIPLLMRLGANPCWRDQKGQTAVMTLVQGGHMQHASALVSLMSQDALKMRNAEGYNALMGLISIVKNIIKVNHPSVNPFEANVAASPSETLFLTDLLALMMNSIDLPTRPEVAEQWIRCIDLMRQKGLSGSEKNQQGESLWQVLEPLKKETKYSGLWWAYVERCELEDELGQPHRPRSEELKVSLESSEQLQAEPVQNESQKKGSKGGAWL